MCFFCIFKRGKRAKIFGIEKRLQKKKNGPRGQHEKKNSEKNFLSAEKCYDRVRERKKRVFRNVFTTVGNENECREKKDENREYPRGPLPYPMRQRFLKNKYRRKMSGFIFKFFEIHIGIRKKASPK